MNKTVTVRFTDKEYDKMKLEVERINRVCPTCKMTLPKYVRENLAFL